MTDKLPTSGANPEHAPNWGFTKEHQATRLLCMQCVAEIHIPSVSVVVHWREGPEGLGPGAWALDKARRARDDGHRVELDNIASVGIYAETMVNGNAVCVAHMFDAVRGAGFPYKAW